jgi:aspartyl-tRNA(Asn)/glutamyl-tRNA(Gln) amidotransferase subunit A
MLARGALTTSADYAQAQRFRARFCRDVAQLMAEFDVLVTPGGLGPAERVDQMDLDRRMTGPSFTGQWNLAGLPAVVFPCGAASSSGLPLSIQIIGRPFAEGTVLRVADAYQRLTDWHLRVPPVATLVSG